MLFILPVLLIKYRLVVLLKTFFKACVTLKHFLQLFFEMKKYYQFCKLY